MYNLTAGKFMIIEWVKVQIQLNVPGSKLVY